MKVKIKKVITPEVPAVTQETEIEISFPFYSKDAEGAFYKLLNERAGIKVYSLGGIERVTHLRYSNITPFEDEIFTAQLSNEQEFNNAYNKAMTIIEMQYEPETTNL